MSDAFRCDNCQSIIDARAQPRVRATCEVSEQMDPGNARTVVTDYCDGCWSVAMDAMRASLASGSCSACGPAHFRLVPAERASSIMQ